MKEIIEDLQAKNIYFKTQVENLTTENNELTSTNKRLLISNESLTSEINFLKKAQKEIILSKFVKVTLVDFYIRFFCNK